MPAEISHKIRDLSADEISAIKAEIEAVTPMIWIKHFKDITNPLLALKDGESIHLNWPASEEKYKMPERIKFFPKIESIIRTFVEPNKLGRAYIHRLKPGDRIPPHHDKIHVQNINILHRYHLYLDVLDNNYLRLDDAVVEKPSIFQFSIIDFALEKVHAYKNNSNTNWYFVVFDVCAS